MSIGVSLSFQYALIDFLIHTFFLMSVFQEDETRCMT